MLEKLFGKLGYIKKEKYDSLGNEFQKLAQVFGETMEEKKKLEILITSLIMCPHTIFNDHIGNFITISNTDLEMAKKCKLNMRVNLFNQVTLRVERKEEDDK